MKMDEYIGEVESWIDQVRDDDLGVGDYDFLDEAAHKGRDGNNGLAQLGAHLAIYREDGEIKIDYELIDELESRQEELPQGGRNRFSNIVYEGTTDKRDGKTLRDKMEEGTTVGHERLETMLEEAKENIDNLSEVEAPESNYPEGRNQAINKSGVTIRLIQGDNTMADGLLEEIYETAQDYKDEGMDELQAYQSALEDHADHAAEADRDIQAIETALRELNSDVDDVYAELQREVGRAEGKREALEDDLEDRKDSKDAAMENIFGQNGRYSN